MYTLDELSVIHGLLDEFSCVITGCISKGSPPNPSPGCVVITIVFGSQGEKTEMMLIDINAVKNEITEKHIALLRLLLLQTVREKPLSPFILILFNKFCEIPEQIVRPRYM